MASTVSRGNYYKRKTKEWFEKQGYTVQLTEFLTARPLGGGRVIYVKKDVFGSDGISMNGQELIFWNSKHCTNTETSTLGNIISQGKKEFSKYPFPETVKKQLIIWFPRIKNPRILGI